MSDLETLQQQLLEQQKSQAASEELAQQRAADQDAQIQGMAAMMTNLQKTLEALTTTLANKATVEATQQTNTSVKEEIKDGDKNSFSSFSSLPDGAGPTLDPYDIALLKLITEPTDPGAIKSSIQSVPKLTTSNSKIWKKRFSDYLEAAGLLPAVLKLRIPDTSLQSDQSFDVEYDHMVGVFLKARPQRWKTAYINLKATITDATYDKIVKENEPEANNFFYLWDRIQLYMNISCTHADIAKWREEFANITMGQNEKAKDLIGRLEELAFKVNSARPNTIDEQDLCLKLKIAIKKQNKKKYKPALNKISLSTKERSWMWTIKQIYACEQDDEDSGNEADEGLANAAVAEKAPRYNSNTNCTYCKKSGHVIGNCRKKQRIENKYCSYCDTTGQHYITDCPRKPFYSGKGSSETACFEWLRKGRCTFETNKQRNPRGTKCRFEHPPAKRGNWRNSEQKEDLAQTLNVSTNNDLANIMQTFTTTMKQQSEILANLQSSIAGKQTSSPTPTGYSGTVETKEPTSNYSGSIEISEWVGGFAQSVEFSTIENTIYVHPNLYSCLQTEEELEAKKEEKPKEVKIAAQKRKRNKRRNQRKANKKKKVSIKRKVVSHELNNTNQNKPKITSTSTLKLRKTSTIKLKILNLFNTLCLLLLTYPIEILKLRPTKRNKTTTETAHTASSSPEILIFDTGCTRIVTNDKSKLRNLKQANIRMKVANQQVTYSNWTGDMDIAGKTFNDVVCCETFDKTLISWNVLDKMGYRMEGEDGTIHIYDEEGILWTKWDGRTDGLYHLDQN